MSELSRLCKLSQEYTNHSVRVTGATILSKCMYGPAQIMALTGHKSVQSLTVYQRVDDDEKLQMGQTLTNSLVGLNQRPALPPPQNYAQSQVVSANIPVTLSDMTNATVPSVNSSNQNHLIAPPECDFLDGIDIGQIFDDFKENDCLTNVVASNQSKGQFFKDCKITIIHNLTINK